VNLAALWLVDPARIRAALQELRESGVHAEVPNEWQLGLGVVRMWHRLLFRSDTIGTSRGVRRAGWRARGLSWRAVRLPFLVAEGVVHPLDLSGLRIGREGLIRHLLAAHHDQHQCVYDLELLGTWPGALDELIERTRAVVSGRDSRADWLRDLVVFEGYHQALLEAAEALRDGRPLLTEAEAADPDISFRAYLAWCCRQPATPRATWGRLWT
jgi:hypothetical protein